VLEKMQFGLRMYYGTTLFHIHKPECEKFEIQDPAWLHPKAGNYKRQHYFHDGFRPDIATKSIEGRLSRGSCLDSSHKTFYDRY
jgi:hypothetical protein